MALKSTLGDNMRASHLETFSRLHKTRYDVKQNPGLKIELVQNMFRTAEELCQRSCTQRKDFDLEPLLLYIIHLPPYHTLYLLLRYQLNANCCTSAGNGVGTSDNPGLATGCLKYTAEQILWLTSKYRGTNAKALIYGLGRQGVA